jgi:hypothetical protein
MNAEMLAHVRSHKRRMFGLLCALALLLAACGGGSPEEQMFGAVFDVYFADMDRHQPLKHRVVYIVPTFADQSQQPVPPEIITAILARTSRLGLTQVQAPDNDGVIISLYTINRSQPDPIVSIHVWFPPTTLPTN